MPPTATENLVTALVDAGYDRAHAAEMVATVPPEYHEGWLKAFLVAQEEKDSRS